MNRHDLPDKLIPAWRAVVEAARQQGREHGRIGRCRPMSVFKAVRFAYYEGFRETVAKPRDTTHDDDSVGEVAAS